MVIMMKDKALRLITIVKKVLKSDRIMYLEDSSRWLLIAGGSVRDDVRLLSKVAAMLAGILLMALSARISFTIPFTEIPFTFQTFMLVMIVLMSGKDAWKIISTYLMLGFAGLPLFAYGGGLQYIVSPTAGYLIGFLVASLLGRYVGRNRGIVKLMLISLTIIVIVYFFGWLWLSIYYTLILGFNNLLTSMYVAFLRGIVPFIIWDFMKALTASLVSHEAYKFKGKLKVLSTLISNKVI